MTDLETISGALDVLDDFLELDGTTYAGADPKTWREALARLRADPNRLDLASVPETKNG